MRQAIESDSVSDVGCISSPVVCWEPDYSELDWWLLEDSPPDIPVCYVVLPPLYVITLITFFNFEPHIVHRRASQLFQ
jgi:hypothetical protein